MASVIVTPLPMRSGRVSWRAFEDLDHQPEVPFDHRSAFEQPEVGAMLFTSKVANTFLTHTTSVSVVANGNQCYLHSACSRTCA